MFVYKFQSFFEFHQPQINQSFDLYFKCSIYVLCPKNKVTYSIIKLCAGLCLKSNYICLGCTAPLTSVSNLIPNSKICCLKIFAVNN